MLVNVNVNINLPKALNKRKLATLSVMQQRNLIMYPLEDLICMY